MSKSETCSQIYFGGPWEQQLDTNETRASGGVIYLYNDPQSFLSQIEQRIRSLDTGIPPTASMPYETLLRNRVSTDEIIRVPDLLTIDISSLGENVLCGLPREYKVEKGTIKQLQGTVLVASDQFGRGSSREQAVIAIQKAGITAVIAPSFGPIFRENADNLGLLTSTDLSLAEKIQRGDGVGLSEFLKNRSYLTQTIIKSGGLFKFLNKIRSGKIEMPKIPEKSRLPMNILEKRLSRIIGESCVQIEDEFLLRVDKAASYVVLSGLARQVLLHEYGDIHVKIKPDLFEDHFAYSKHPGVVELTQEQRLFSNELDLPPENYFYGRKKDGGGKGIIHRVLLEKTDPREIQCIIVTDSHTPTLGSLPLLALPVGSTMFAAGIAEGLIPFSTPQVMRVELTGKLPPGASIRDAQLEIAVRFKAMLKDKTAQEVRVIEFGGHGLDTLTFNQVTALGNMVPEVFNAEIAVTEAFEAGLTFLNEHWGIPREEALELYGKPDPDCIYTNIFEFDLSKTSPWIALPGDPSNGIPLSEFKNQTVINKAYIASCTNGLEELMEAAAVLLNQKVATTTQFIIVPSSQKIFDEAQRRGYLKILREAGATVREEIACSACIGDGPDAVLPGETAISATNRNFSGRMDPSKQGHVYLGGSIITSLSAIIGRIPTSEEYLNHSHRILKNLKVLDQII